VVFCKGKEKRREEEKKKERTEQTRRGGTTSERRCGGKIERETEMERKRDDFSCSSRRFLDTRKYENFFFSSYRENMRTYFFFLDTRKYENINFFSSYRENMRTREKVIANHVKGRENHVKGRETTQECKNRTPNTTH